MHRLLVLALSLALPLSTQAQTIAGTTESWNVVRIGGTAVGTASEGWAVDDTSIVVRVQMNVHFTRMGTPLSMNLFTEETSDGRGNFRRARMTSTLSNLEASAVLDGDSLRYTSQAGGTTHRRVLAWDKRAVTETIARERIAEWLAGSTPETGLTMFDVSDGEFHTQRFVRGETRSEAIAGAQRSLIVVEEYDDDAATATSTTYFTSDGEAWRTVVRQLGVEIVIERVTPEELSNLEIETSFDIIRQSMVRCVGFPASTGISSVTLSLSFAGKLPPKSMDGPNQVEVGRDEHSLLLKLTRATAKGPKLDQRALAPFLRPERFIQSDNPVLKAVADSLRTDSGAKDWELAKSITTYVNTHIASKGMEHGYDSALDVYRSRAGDCTEHSLLTVALLRAAGIPARPAVGLAYGVSEGAFVGHMWVEAYVDGWRTLDALDLSLDPIRIRVHAPESSEALGERDLMRAYGAVAGVAIRVTDHQ